MKRVVFLFATFILLTNMSFQANASAYINSNTLATGILKAAITKPATITTLVKATETLQVAEVKPIRYATEINFNQADKGIVTVFYNESVEKKMKLIVQLGKEQYVYNLFRSNDPVNYPLQLGDGLYSVSIYENTTGTKYKKIATSSYQVALEDSNSVYLQSILEISWKEDDKSIKLADELVAQALQVKKSKTAVAKQADVVLTENEVINELYLYVIKNIVYDYKKITGLDYTYVPNNDALLIAKKGICYDYSSLLASMLRSQGIPAKMAKGYANKSTTYHAWNEIYLSTEKRWVVVDSTNDAYLIQNKLKYTFEKPRSAYDKVKEF